MTNEKKAAQMTARNEAICTYYKEGRKLKECASKFRLGRQQVMNILKQAGVWQPYVKGARTQFLGVSVSEQTKEALRKKADEEGKSVSRLASDVLDEVVAEGTK